jgi:hypothetical protein
LTEQHELTTDFTDGTDIKSHHLAIARSSVIRVIRGKNFQVIMHFKEILAGMRSCFSLTVNERLIVILILAFLLLGLSFRWQRLARERSDGYEPSSAYKKNVIANTGAAPMTLKPK